MVKKEDEHDPTPGRLLPTVGVVALGLVWALAGRQVVDDGLNAEHCLHRRLRRRPMDGTGLLLLHFTPVLPVITLVILWWRVADAWWQWPWL